ncbi:MAG TPA: hypothetical protein VK477_04710, partial [Acidobacteriota bacterium]|nr:hypothetical protein [Acidobacteriota bacterium]
MNAPRRLAVLLACMLSSGWLAAQTTFTWTGNATTFPYGYGFAYANAGANWLGGTAPTADDNALLSFGASAGISSNASLSVEFPYSFAVRGLTFTAPAPSYYIHSDDGGRLRLGEGATGPTLTLAGSGNSMVHIDSKIELAGNQTWAINDGTVYVYGRIDQSASGTALTKTGNGALFLDNSSSTFGSLNLQGGTLYVGASSSLGDSELISGPVGSGTLTLGDYTTLRTSTYSGSGNDDLTLHNPISLGNHVTLGNFAERNSITLAGAITPQSTNTTVEVGVDGALFIGQISRAENGSLVFAGGNISDASGGPTTMTFTSSSASRNDTLNAATPVSSEDPFPVVVLSGNNTYTGATIADGVGIIFYAPGSLGQTSSISANNGYVGTGYNGGMEAILARIAQPTSFYGALGFDTHPAAAEITVFNDNVDLSRFTNDSGGPSDGFWGLGSLTKAIITGTITPPTGGNYVFGGQEGTLYVQSNLTAPTGVRVRTPYGENPLSVWLRGANSFTGNIMSDHSIVVLDSATALPTGSSFSLDSGAYLGYTENFTAGGASTVTPAQFI